MEVPTMSIPCALVAALLAAPPVASHPEANPVFRGLTEQGLPVGGERRIKLSPPLLPDGLAPQAQQQALAKAADENYPLEELQRNSTVAPFRLVLRDIDATDPNNPVRGIDLYFFIYGDLDTLVKKEFRQRLLSLSQSSAKARDLTAADLAKRKIELKPAAGAEEDVMSHRSFSLFDRVEVSDTQRVVLTRTADSLVMGSELDPRFAGDAEFPNQWRAITRGDNDQPVLGPPQPGAGSGSYLKVTRLAEPAGALFVEFHAVFVEPHGWFDGANLIRSKLPIVVQNEVRSLRRELLKAK
jgi:hypothetical protein